MPHSKRYQRSRKLIDPAKLYSSEEAIELAQKTSTTKFEEALEVHLKLGIDSKKSGGQVRGVITLPHGIGKVKPVACFTSTPEEAKKAGAFLAGGEDLIKEIRSTKRCDFKIALAEPSFVPQLVQIAKILGPKGLMPSSKNETVTSNIVESIKSIQKGKTVFKMDEGGNLHQTIGRTSWTGQKLLENFNAFLVAVRRSKPRGFKGNFIRRITLSSTMGPGIRVRA